MEKTEKLDKKSIARSLYLHSGQTQEEIANKIGITRQTVSRWAKAENWDEQKASLTVTPQQIIAQWNQQILVINQRINSREPDQRFATAQEADAMVKLAGAIKKMQQDTGISDCISVAMRFLSWLRPHDVDAAMQFGNLFDAFIKDVVAHEAGR